MGAPSPARPQLIGGRAMGTTPRRELAVRGSVRALRRLHGQINGPELSQQADDLLPANAVRQGLLDRVTQLASSFVPSAVRRRLTFAVGLHSPAADHGPLRGGYG